MTTREEKIERPPTTFERIGGDEGLKLLVQLFYDNMETLTEARTIRDLHP